MSLTQPRFVFVVLDGLGVGELPDADSYGDAGSNTLGNLAATVDLRLPHLGALGLGNILPLRGVPPVRKPGAFLARLAERSRGKDTTAGHWEHMGLVTEEPLPTYPKGFPSEIISSFEQASGRRILGNRPASGTEIIAELGEEHLRTGRPIVYTSADSVFQIAAHIEVIPLEELYELCRLARRLLQGPHAVGRVIARPFAGRPGSFHRTRDRKDFSLPPPGTTYLDLMQEAEIRVTALGKVSQIFAGRGIDRSVPVESNRNNLETLISLLRQDTGGLLFTNLVDFDMLWGHRNDPEGFARGLEEVDGFLPQILECLGPEDHLLLTADHGVDPTTTSTDHSREYVPALLFPRPEQASHDVYEGWFSDTGATAVHVLTKSRPPGPGHSFLEPDPPRGLSPYAPPFGVREAFPDCGPAVSMLGQRLGEAPRQAVVLGSGLAGAAGGFEPEAELQYAEIPGWLLTRVPGHQGRLVVGRLGGIRVLMLFGRVHRYEYPRLYPGRIIFRSLKEWGVETVLSLNAAGSLTPALVPGQMVFVERVVDCSVTALEGAAPGRTFRLGGEGDSRTLFPDLARVTYASVAGPQYETGAEVAALRELGAEIVGMSGGDEADGAAFAGTALWMLSAVTNRAGVTAEGESDCGARDEHTAVLRRAEELSGRAAACVAHWITAARG